MPDRRPSGANAADTAQRKGWGVWLGIGCGALLTLGVTGLIVVAIMVRPYARASQEFARALQAAAPDGTQIDRARITFPAQVLIDRIAFPAVPARGLPALTLQDISGSTTLRSWLRLKPDVSVATHVWGGTVHVHAVSAAPLAAQAVAPPSWHVEGSVRGVRVEECVAWLQVEGDWRGRVSATGSGYLDGRDLRASTLDANVSGEELYVPPLEFKEVILPANAHVTMQGRITHRDGELEVVDFRLRGTGYDVDASARIGLREPLEDSTLDGRVALRLKEAATWQRSDNAAALAGIMMQLLIESKGTLHARLSGTLGDPKIVMDESAIIRGLFSRGE